MVRLGILGPLLVADDVGHEIPVAAARQRALLAALLVNANHTVPVDELAEFVWDGAPPTGAAATLRAYVMRLRNTLGPACATRIETRAPGYLCQVAEDELDVLRFEALCRAASTALHISDWGKASAASQQALELWRGTPLLDVASQTLQQRVRPRLEQLRLQALEDHCDAELRQGRYDQLLPQLQELTTRYPLRERFHAQLMAALAGSGRQAEALEVYQDARRALVDELGVEPGAELRQLHQRVLRGEVFAAPAENDPVDLSVRAVPCQLPAAAAHFTGRSAQLARLAGLLNQTSAGRGAVVISAIGGTAGVGKTTLAVHFAHQAADRFPDGQLYVNLRGYDADEPLSATDALAGFLRALGVAGGEIPSGLDERAAAYRSLLANRRTLVVLDNAHSAEQVRPLLPGTAASLVLVTSRDSLAGLVARDGAIRLELDALPAADALALLRALLGPRVDTEARAAAALAEQCGRLPLALRVAAELAAARPQAPLADLVGELTDERRRLDLLRAGGDGATGVRVVLSWSYRHLEPCAARAFRLLALHPGADFDPYVAAALTGNTYEEVCELLQRLSCAHLLRPTEAGRYAMHDLLRVYGRELAAAEEGATGRHAALISLLDHYLHTAAAAMNTLHPAEATRRPRLTESQVILAPVMQSAAATSWLNAERPNLVAASTLAAEQSPGHAIALAGTLERYLNLGFHLDDAHLIHGYALRAARLGGDRAAEATALSHLGFLEWLRGRYPQAIDHQQLALSLWQQAGDRLGVARASHRMALTERSLGHFEAAVEHAARALAISRDEGDRLGQNRALQLLGMLEEKQGRWIVAADHFRQVLALAQALGDRLAQSTSVKALGVIELRLGRLDAAAEHFERALTLCQQTGNVDGQAGALARLGQVSLRRGRVDNAGAFLRRALEAYQKLRDQHGECESHIWLAQVEARAGRHEHALAHLDQALRLVRSVRAQDLAAEAFNVLGEVLVDAGRADQALIQHTSALETARGIGQRDELARAHRGLARAYTTLGDRAEARNHLSDALAAYDALAAPEAGQVRAELAALQRTGVLPTL